jgi:hypothetical protein
MPIDTTKVKDRRKVEYSSLQQVLEDAQRLCQGNVKALGNWSPGQIFQHLAWSFDTSIDGNDAKFPWWLRMIAPLMKKKLLGSPMPPGFKLPESAQKLVPGPTSTEEGLAALRAAIARQERESSRAPNPVFGELTRNEWNQLHLKHAALHMSFLVPA